MKRQLSIGAWFCVVERRFNILDDQLIPDHPPLAQNVVVSADWTDEPDSQVQAPDVRQSNAAVEMNAVSRTTVCLVGLGARELIYTNNSLHTPLVPMYCHVVRVAFIMHMSVSTCLPR